MIQGNAGKAINLAGHLCGDRCQQLLDGEFSFIDEILSLGIQRVQINATAANSVIVEESKFKDYVNNTLKCAESYPSIEFILQYNEETKGIWTPLVATLTDSSPKNLVLLFDASCGTGVRVTQFPSPYTFEHISSCGYAGGIGPDCIEEILQCVKNTVAAPRPSATKRKLEDDNNVESHLNGSHHRGVWIDMESSLRALVLPDRNLTSVPKDVFSIEKCFACISAAKRFGLVKKI